jgi:hypothetical protein
MSGSRWIFHLKKNIRKFPAVYYIVQRIRVAYQQFCIYFGLVNLLNNEFSDLSRAMHNGRLPVISAQAESNSARILFFSPRIWDTHVVWEVAIAQSLQLRGATVRFATCGGDLPICELQWGARLSPNGCFRCYNYVHDYTGLAGFSSISVRERVDDAEIKQVVETVRQMDFKSLRNFKWLDLALGQYALPPARWVLRTGKLEKHPAAREVLQDFVESAIRLVSGLRRVLEEYRPDVLVLLNGMFMEERVAHELAKRLNIRVVLYEVGRQADSVFFSHNIAACRYDISQSWSSRQETLLSAGQKARLGQLLGDRSRGDGVVEQYWKETLSSKSVLQERLGLYDGRPLATLFTNVTWDTSVQERDTVFVDLFDWLETSIQLFLQHPEWDLVIRVHPAETQLPERQSADLVTEIIAESLGDLPSNVRVIPPDQPLNSYALMQLATIGLVYASTIGLEMACAGVPVIVASDAHYASKGFTFDIRQREDYASLVARLMSGDLPASSDERRELACRYAYHFFVRRTLPMEIMTYKNRYKDRLRLLYGSLDDLQPGNSHTMDVICRGVLDGSEFEIDPP